MEREDLVIRALTEHFPCPLQTPNRDHLAAWISWAGGRRLDRHLPVDHRQRAECVRAVRVPIMARLVAPNAQLLVPLLAVVLEALDAFSGRPHVELADAEELARGIDTILERCNASAPA